jgi:hypothetical protein
MSPVGNPQPPPADERLAAAWTLALGDLDTQRASVDELRTRVGVLIAAAGIATSVLSSNALAKTKGVPVGAVVGTCAAAALVCVCIGILWPRKWKGHYTRAHRLHRLYVDTGTDLDYMHRDMALHASRDYWENQQRLDRMYNWYAAALLLLLVDFAGWLWVLA